MRRILPILCAIIITALTVSVYWQVKDYGPINLDDNWFITENPLVIHGFTKKSVIQAFGTHHATYWVPVTTLSVMADMEFFGPNYGMHHLANLFFHTIGAILLFFALRAMTGAVWTSALAATLFAVHPINVETVCWLAQRKTILTGFFWSATLLFYAFYAKKPGFLRYFWVFLATGLCLMSKPSALPLPFVLLVIDYWPLCRVDWGPDCGNGPIFAKTTVPGLILEKIPLFILSFASMVFSCLSGHKWGGLSLSGEVPFFLRVENALVSCVKYLGKLVWHQGPSVFYPFPKEIPAWQVCGAIFILVCLAVIIIKNAKKAPFLLTGFLWFGAYLGPACGVAQVKFFPAMADRFVYLPAMGLFVAIAWTLRALAQNRPVAKKIIPPAVAVAVLGLGVAAWNQAGFWQNNLLLFSQATKTVPKSYVAQHNLAVALDAKGEHERAIFHYKKTIGLFPDSPLPYYNLGNTLFAMGKAEQAADLYKKTLFLDPDFTRAHNNLGLILLERGDMAQALNHFHKALAINPNFIPAINNIEDALNNKKGNFDALVKNQSQRH